MPGKCLGVRNCCKFLSTANTCRHCVNSEESNYSINENNPEVISASYLVDINKLCTTTMTRKPVVNKNLHYLLKHKDGK